MIWSLRKLLLLTTASTLLLGFRVNACIGDEGSFRAPTGAGLQEVNIRQHVRDGKITLNERQLSRYDMLMWVLVNQLPSMQGQEDEAYYLYDYYGQHWSYLELKQGKWVLGAHRFPPLGAQNTLLADSRVIASMINREMPFHDAIQSKLFTHLDPQSTLAKAMALAF